MITKGQLRLLQPYLEGDSFTHTNEDGTREWNMQCPIHEDGRRSASVNLDKGYWFCQAGCGGGPVSDLIRVKDDWHPPLLNGHSNGHKPYNGRKIEPLPSESSVLAWSSSLLSNEVKLEELIALRGVTTDTVRRYKIGWSVNKNVYTIPVYDLDGQLVSLRYYNPHPEEGRRKIWGVTGHNTPHLFPKSALAGDWDYIVICEGEWDAIVTNQNGFRAITRTAAAKVWRSEWNAHFEGKTVYLCHDADDTGRMANRKVARALRDIAADVRVVTLPFEHQAKNGQDLTDFWDLHDRGDFEQLLRDSTRLDEKSDDPQDDPDVVTVLDSFDSQRVGQATKLMVTIKGRKEPGYSIPRKATLECTMDAGAKCVACPLNGKKGDDAIEIANDDPVVLSMLDTSKAVVEKELLTDYGIPGGKCGRLDVNVQEYQAVEILFARPSLDHADGTKAGDYKNVKITSVGRHDTMSNSTVLLTGALHPSPRTHGNEFLAWDVKRTEASFDRFKLDDRNIQLMRRFQTSGRPIAKMAEIAKDLARHVTRIHGRPEMHVFMDLVFHGVLNWKFAGEFIDRGWVEGVIVGDTRTGKSLAATRLVRHYGAGEIISCEAASFAGIVGGVQQMNGKDWAVTWGAIPINDRRLVVLDEISGLTTEEISQMSDVRSSGVAKLTKIMQDMTHARTRLLWLGNPRDATMSNFTHGVDALKPLVGNAEDIARFDIAMAASLHDVAAAEINTIREGGDLQYSSEACHSLLMWAWSRAADQVIWTPGSIEKVFECSNDMGARYTEDPPLVQAANIRIKIARVAVSMAARLFSTDSSYENIVVRPEHVADAVFFMDKVYGMSSFGYAERSRERIKDRREAESKRDDIKQYLLGRPELAKFLKMTGKFRRQDLEEIINLSKEEANAVINTLWAARMVWKDKGDIRIEPTLHSLLREVRL